MICDRCLVRPPIARVYHGGTDMGRALCLPCWDWLMAELRDDCHRRGEHEDAESGWAKWQQTRLDWAAGFTPPV